MSKLVKTPNKIDSKRKKEIQYSLAWLSKDWFQLSKTQVGIKKAVKSIILKAKPSIPTIKLIFIESNQRFFWTNWNVEIVGSKKKRRKKERFSISKDQPKEKLRISL
jgi:hypothetical protein